MPNKHKQKNSKKNSKNKSKKNDKKNDKSKKNKNQYVSELSLEDQSLVDFKKSKSFSVATSLSEYKSKSHIGEIYDYKPLRNKINNMCINKVISKDPLLNKKISKDLCECMFDKNKNLSISELESRYKLKKDIPSINCITIYDKYMKNKTLSKSNKSSKYNKLSKSNKT